MTVARSLCLAAASVLVGGAVLLVPPVLGFSVSYAYRGPQPLRTELQRYLSGDSIQLAAPQLSEVERYHLGDVRRLVLAATLLVSLAALAVAGVARWGNAELSWILRAGGSAAAATAALLLALAAAAPTWAFETFHRLTFSNGAWLLSYDSTLIQLYPPSYWAVAGAVSLLLSFSLGAALARISRWRWRGKFEIRISKLETSSKLE